MTTKTKSYDLQIKAGETAGTFTAYGNTFNNIDLAGDKTIKGAFANCIKACIAKSRMPRLLSQHGHRANPIGIITSMKEDENGLLFEGKFCTEPGTQGAEAYALVKMGALDSFSIGFNTIKDKMVEGVKELHELDVKEISLVTFACDENSLLQSVKMAVEDGTEITPRMIQKALQEAGLSKRQASAAVDAVKGAVDTRLDGINPHDLFLSHKEAAIVPTENLSVKSDMSMGDYASMICKAVCKNFKGEMMDSYVVDLYMDYAVSEVYDWSEADQTKNYYMKTPYTKSEDGNDILVGSSVEVMKSVDWLTDEERTARKVAGIKQDPSQIKSLNEDSLLDEMATQDFSTWFK